MTQPDGHRFGLRAEGGFGFECGATERQRFAAPRNRIGDGRVQEAQIDRQPFSV